MQAKTALPGRLSAAHDDFHPFRPSQFRQHQEHFKMNLHNPSPIYDMARLHQAEIHRRAERSRMIAQISGYQRQPGVIQSLRRVVGLSIVRAGQWIQGEHRPALVDEIAPATSIGLAR